MRKYVIFNRNQDVVYIRPYTITSMVTSNGINIYTTDVDDVILESEDHFDVGETVFGKEYYSDASWCRGMVEC